MSKSFAAIVMFLLALGVSSSPLAEGEKATEKILEVAFYESGYLYSNGVGIDIDVINEIKNRGGYSFRPVEMSRARIWKDLAETRLAMSVSGIQTPERDTFAYFIPYIVQNNKAIVAHARYTTPESILNDKAAKIAVVRSFKHGEYFDAFIDKFRANGGDLTEVATSHNLFLMLKAGDRVEMIISQPAFYAKALKEMGLESSAVIRDWDSPPKKPIVLSLILSKAHFSEVDVAEMKKIVQAMKKDGTLRRIFSKYLSKKDVEEALNF